MWNFFLFQLTAKNCTWNERFMGSLVFFDVWERKERGLSAKRKKSSPSSVFFHRKIVIYIRAGWLSIEINCFWQCCVFSASLLPMFSAIPVKLCVSICDTLVSMIESQTQGFVWHHVKHKFGILWTSTQYWIIDKLRGSQKYHFIVGQMALRWLFFFPHPSLGLRASKRETVFPQTENQFVIV